MSLEQLQVVLSALSGPETPIRITIIDDTGKMISSYVRRYRTASSDRAVSIGCREARKEAKKLGCTQYSVQEIDG
jgi:hypothetical protein